MNEVPHGRKISRHDGRGGCGRDADAVTVQLQCSEVAVGDFLFITSYCGKRWEGALRIGIGGHALPCHTTPHRTTTQRWALVWIRCGMGLAGAGAGERGCGGAQAKPKPKNQTLSLSCSGPSSEIAHPFCVLALRFLGFLAGLGRYSR